MKIDSPAFIQNSHDALANPVLQQALKGMETGLAAKRQQAYDKLPEFEAMRQAAKELKAHILDHLDIYLELFEAAAIKAGGKVHWARDAAEARAIILDICDQKQAKLVTKGKSMVSEEIGINQALEDQGIEVAETDLGEYIIQLRREAPSHIIAPAIHILQEQIEADFRHHHQDQPPTRTLDTGPALVAEARKMLRAKYAKADIGITGANFLIAETGQSVIVTNEGNGDLTQNLAKTHLVIAGIEKVVPTLEDANLLLRLLGRSATGQALSSYTSFALGGARDDDADGPKEWHIVLIDNGRSQMLAGKQKQMLSCLRCGACMNVCPVYRAVGGHAYGWVYPGPMGAVLTPLFIGIDKAVHLPNASSFCGRCAEVCPVKIPLPDLMRHWRETAVATGQVPRMQKAGLAIWGLVASRPRLYHFITPLMMGILKIMAGRKGHVKSLPFLAGWTKWRNFPAPSAGGSFVKNWQKRGGGS